MSPAELREYAETLILEHARDIEFVTIFEMAEDYAPGGEITDAEVNEVDDKLSKATITISWPEGTWSQ